MNRVERLLNLFPGAVMQHVFDLDARPPSPRETAESLRRSRAWPYLAVRDRTIVEMTEKGLSHRLVGQVLGVNPATVGRRLTQLRTRLASPLARLALDPTTPLPADCRETARLHAVTGLSLREAARVRSLPLHAVTDHVRFAQGVARGLAARR